MLSIFHIAIDRRCYQSTILIVDVLVQFHVCYYMLVHIVLRINRKCASND